MAPPSLMILGTSRLIPPGGTAGYALHLLPPPRHRLPTTIISTILAPRSASALVLIFFPFFCFDPCSTMRFWAKDPPRPCKILIQNQVSFLSIFACLRAQLVFRRAGTVRSTSCEEWRWHGTASKSTTSSATPSSSSVSTARSTS